MKKNVLIFPCGSEIALDIYELVKYSIHFNLIGASSVKDHGCYCYDDYIDDVPFVTDKNFVPVIKKIVREKKVDAIYPTMDLAIYYLKKYESEIGCKVVASPFMTTEICLSKSKTYNLLRGKLLVPELYDVQNVSKFPCFAKPDIGYGSRGTKVLNDRNELLSFYALNKDSLIMEFLPGEEYTIDCFTDRNRKLLYANARLRARIKDGVSVNTYFAKDQRDFLKIANIINESMLFRGAWFFQVKRNERGTLYLLEVASRIGGSSLLSNAIGVNLALLSLFDIFDIRVSVLQNNYYVELDRSLNGNCYKAMLEYDSVYCDYDDCLILNKSKINNTMISFLFKCINERKKIILLTKHKGDLAEELRRFRLNDIFDEIIHISEEKNKYEYIKRENSIFIDDSHAERKCVKEKIGIPVFSPEMINVLL